MLRSVICVMFWWGSAGVVRLPLASVIYGGFLSAVSLSDAGLKGEHLKRGGLDTA